MTIHAHPALTAPAFVLRTAVADDAAALAAFVNAHQEEGHLLPRQEDEVRARASRFVVVEVEGEIAACAELVPLSSRLAEVRSLVVSGTLRRHGVASLLVDELRRRARTNQFQSLLVLAHDPRFFIRHDFSLVPHEWLPEKITRDCAGCPMFRRCGQHAMLLPLGHDRHAGARRSWRAPAAAIA